MANPISSDNLLTQPRPKRQETGGSDANPRATSVATGQPGKQKAEQELGEPAGLERARQRLAQELGEGSVNAPQSGQQARALVDNLGAQLAADPKAGLAAHGAISPDLYSAATAQPNR